MAAERVNVENFDEALMSAKNVLVDFYADWCGPCKLIAPIVEETAEKYKDSLTVIKLNIDKARPIAEKFGVLSVPTLILFKEGRLLKTSVGVKTQQAIDEWLTLD